MAELPIPAQFVRLKRAVIGGLLSTSPVIIVAILNSLKVGLPKAIYFIYYFLLNGFLLPAIPFWNSKNSLLSWLGVILLWFCLGALIAGMIKNKKIAVVCWLALLGLSTYVAVALCVFCF